MLLPDAKPIEGTMTPGRRRYTTRYSGSLMIAWTKPTLILLIGLAFVLTAQPLFTYDHDMSLYLGLARSLSRGDGYVFNGSFNEQVPPGLPVLLAPFATLFAPENVRSYQYVVIAFAVAALFLTWAWAREAHRPFPWLTAIIVGLTSGFFYISTAVVYAEAPFMVASLAVLWWSERAIDPMSRVRSGLPLVFFALCAVAVPALRTVGIALPIALIISAAHETIRRRMGRSSPTSWPRAALLLALASLAFVVLWSRVVSARASGQYGGGFAPSYMAHLKLRSALEPDLGTLGLGGMLLRIPENIVREGAHIAEMFTGIGWVRPFWLSPVIVLICALVIVGWYQAFRRDQPLMAWYPLVFGGIIALWPFDEGQRFLIPIAPLLASLLIDGAQRAIAFTQTASRDQRRFLSLVLFLIGFLTLVTLRPWSRPLSRQDWAAIVGWPVLALTWLAAQPITARYSHNLVRSVVGAALFTCFALGNVHQNWTVARSRMSSTLDDLRSAPIARAGDWLSSNAPKDAVVMAESYAALHLRTGLRTVPMPHTGRIEVLSAALRCGQPDYVVVDDPLPDPYVLPEQRARFDVMSRAGLGQFQSIATYRGGEIYRFTAPRLDCNIAR
jgi:hypothetical protein